MRLSRKPSRFGSISMGALMRSRSQRSANASSQRKSSTAQFQFLPTAASLWKTSTATSRSQDGTATKFRLTPSRKPHDQQKLDEARIEVETSSDSVSIKTKYPEHHTNNNPATGDI